MKIILAEENGWRLRKAPFALQLTYVTSLEDLPRFVRTLVDPFALEQASASVELFVFKPTQLIWYLRAFGIQAGEEELNRATLYAESRTEALDLLECMLSQWADFAFIPTPSQFAIDADHDEFTTIFTNDSTALSSLKDAMSAAGFKQQDWIWEDSHSAGGTSEGEQDV